MTAAPSVLVILPPEFEEIEAVAPIDVLRRAGARVVIAALASGVAVTGRNGMLLLAETALAQVERETFDMVFLPGGPGVRHLRNDKRVREIVLRHAEVGRLIAAICAAPLVFHDVGLLKDRRYTAHPSAAGQLHNIRADENVVRDGALLTSRGAGTAVEFGLALVAQLFSETKAAEIRADICA